MDIDSVGSSNNGGRRGERSERRGGRGAGRGGRRGGPNRARGGHQNKQSMSKDALDNDLDNYMMKDTLVAKARLDQEMDAYQQARAH